MIKTEDGMFYLYRDGTPYLHATVEEINEKLDIFNLKSISSLLKILDYPFIIQVWLFSINSVIGNYERGRSEILTRYLAKMNLPTYKDFTYENSKYFNQDIIDDIFS